MKLFDVHCHLQDGALLSDIENVMARAEAAGVERMVCCGTNSNDWKKVLQCSEKFPQIIPMIGIHPWFVNQQRLAGDGSPRLWEEEFRSLEEMVRKVPISGIGETGLDFQPRFSNRAEQESSFAAHLDLARELDRPVAVHCVQAWGRLMDILRDHPAPRVLLHAFGGAPELIPDLTALNCWFSFCGSVTNPRAKRVRASAAAVPDSRLLIETDSPDFPPSGCEFPNEPANLVHVARAVAGLRDVPNEVVAEWTVRNAQSLFHA